MHFHGYYWHGPQFRRRVEVEDAHPDNPGFLISDIPPLKICHWMRRGPAPVRATWDTAAEGTAWMVERHDEVADRISRPAPWTPTDELRAATTANLEAGRDACWSYDLVGGEQVFVAVVSCPNRWEDLECPVKMYTGSGAR